jgi:hypothetical protein
VHMVEGNILGRVSASARTTRRGQRPWHVQTLLAREPEGSLGFSFPDPHLPGRRTRVLEPTERAQRF